MEFGNKKSRWLITFSVMLFCFYLSFNVFKLSSDPSSLENSFFIFKYKDLSESERLVKQADGYREQLGFMVFEKERSDIERQLIRTLYKQINLQSFDSSLWRELMFLQANSLQSKKQASVIDRQWSFLVTKQLSQWNKYERIVLLKRCAYFAFDPKVNVKSTCKALFNFVLKTEKISSIERKLDLSEASLQHVFTYFGVLPPRIGK